MENLDIRILKSYNNSEKDLHFAYKSTKLLPSDLNLHFFYTKL